MSDIHFDIGSLHAAYQSGTGIAEVIDTVLARIAAADDPGIFIHLSTRTEMLAEAEALGPFDPVARPLWGVPFAVKDNIDVAGMPAMLRSQIAKFGSIMPPDIPASELKK